MKNLNEMDLNELWELFPVILREYDCRYSRWYDEAKLRLLDILADHDVCRINHIGSTAVEDLLSKPAIDILLELDIESHREQVIKKLENDNWIVMARDDQAGTVDLNQGYTPDGFAEKVFHLHIKPLGDWDELYFRDYLRDNKEVRKEYEELKKVLRDKYKHDRDAYTDSKSEFINRYSKIAKKEYGNRYKEN